VVVVVEFDVVVELVVADCVVDCDVVVVVEFEVDVVCVEVLFEMIMVDDV
jgi:hypothetical protein